MLEQVERYYSDKVIAHGATAAGVDWRDQESQEVRFAELIKITSDIKTGSIADVGCGWGAFHLWAQRQGFRLDYTGYDISDSQLAAAREACGPDVKFFNRSDGFDPADFVVASGIFNVRFDIPDNDWRKHVDDTIDEMAMAARKGFAFNCLTGFSDADRKVPRLYYPYPGEMLDSVMRRFGRRTSLSHNYGLYEFTICCWLN